MLANTAVSVRRALAFGAFGLCMTGPVVHYWTSWLALQPWARANTYLRTAVDRLVFHPPFQYSFFVFVGIFMGKEPLDVVMRNTNAMIAGVIQRALVFWPPAMFLIFKHAKPRYHALLCNMAALVWSCYLGMSSRS